MKTNLLALSALLALPILGCGSSNTGSFTFVTYDLASAPVDGGGGTVLPPLPPFVGQQIDRMGRPGISRLLLNPFNLAGSGKTLPMVQDSYNASLSQTDTQSGWPSFAARPYIAENLAVFDGIDGNCGNQLSATAGSPAPATRYATLAGLLANDVLNLDTTKKSCGKYLALERGDTVECGGRAPALTAANNVVDLTINLLAGAPTTPFTTGPTSDGDGVSPNIDASPFLLTPN